VYGRLHGTKSAFSVRSKCANSGKEIAFDIDSDLNVAALHGGSEPMLSVPLANVTGTAEPGITDIF
jgi:hypothetical protein